MRSRCCKKRACVSIFPKHRPVVVNRLTPAASRKRRVRSHAPQNERVTDAMLRVAGGMLGGVTQQLHGLEAWQQQQQEQQQQQQSDQQPNADGGLAARLAGMEERQVQLEGLLEHAGLLEGVHFTRQDQRAGDSGTLRPDVAVHLPGGGELLVDAKFPFDAYWQALATEDPSERDALMRRCAREERGIKTRDRLLPREDGQELRL